MIDIYEIIMHNYFINICMDAMYWEVKWDEEAIMSLYDGHIGSAVTIYGGYGIRLQVRGVDLRKPNR